MSKTQRLPKRDQVPAEDTWDLTSLFDDDAAWEAAFVRYERRVKGYEKFRGKLGDSAGVLAKCVAFDSQLDRLGERLGVYAFLRTAEDQTNSVYQRMLGRYQNAAARAAEAASYIRPELLALPLGPTQAAHRPRGDEALSAPDGAARAIQAPHARQEGRRTAGHARRDGPGRQPGLSPTARRRSEVWLRRRTNTERRSS